MRIGKFLSNYLKTKDVTKPVRFTISAAEVATFNEGKENEEAKIVLYAKEHEQGVVCSKDALRQLEELFGSDDTDSWVGKTVELFVDPSVKYQGKNIGGLRFRAAK